MQRWPSLTAEAVCWARALEAKRPDPILIDPYAPRFLRGIARPWVRSSAARLLTAPGLVTSIATRHAWIDRHLTSIMADVEQILILGAGYDSRAWRLPIDDRLVVEIDHPATQARKRRCVERLVLMDAPTFVAADLAKEPLARVLADSPLRASVPTAVVWEGVTMYLRRQDVIATLTALAEFVGEKSHLFADCWRPEDGGFARRTLEATGRWGLGLIGEPIEYACPPEQVPALLHDGGWQARAVSDVGTHARRRGLGAYPDLVLLHAQPATH